MKEHLKLFILLELTMLILNILFSQVQKFFEGAHLIYFLVTVATSLIGVWIGIGLIHITLALYDNKEARFSDLFSRADLILPYVGAAILYGLIVFGGVILLIIPGIIWAMQFGFYKYLVVDKKLGPVEALKASSKMTKGHRWNIFLLTLLVLLINILGLLALGVGLFITIPVGMMAMVYAYRTLEYKPEALVAKEA